MTMVIKMQIFSNKLNINFNTNKNLRTMKNKIYFLILFLCAGIYSLSAQTEHVVHPGDDILQIVADASDGDIVTITPGFYKANQDYITILSKSLTIRSVPGMAMPKVYFKRISLEGDNVNLTLDGIEFSGFDVDSLTGVEDTEDLVAEYFINLSDDLNSFGDIIVKNCIIRNIKVAFIRGDRKNYTGNGFEIDNCIMYDQRDGNSNDYGPFRFKTNIQFDYFTLKNSTIYDVVNRFLNCEALTGFHMDILIDNCTFYNISGKMAKGNNYLFDLRVADDLSFITKDCIYGKTNDDPAAYPDSIKGWYFEEDGPTLYTVMMTTVFAPDFILNQYGLNDVVWDMKAYVEEDFDPEFADPENGNFRLPAESPLLEASEEGGIIGDPRWHPDLSSIHENTSDFKQLKILPNPAENILSITVDNDQQALLISVIGMEIKTLELKKGVNEIDISDLSSGMYFLKPQGDYKTEKLIVR